MSTRELEHHFADLGEVTIHYVTAGAGLADGPLIVLVHGWPQTWYEWRHVMPRLAARHPVIALDMRGLGDSSRPLDGYDKRTVAGDIFRLLAEHLGLERWHCVGHDWGGPVTYALGALHPESMLTMTIIDAVIPGDGGDFSQGGRRWHHAFHLTPDLPEALVTGRERTYLGWFYREFAWRRDAVDASALDEYLRTYTEPGALRAGFAFYRNLPRDAADNAALLATGFRLPHAGARHGRREDRGPRARHRAGGVDEARRARRDRIRDRGQRALRPGGATGRRGPAHPGACRTTPMIDTRRSLLTPQYRNRTYRTPAFAGTTGNGSIRGNRVDVT